MLLVVSERQIKAFFGACFFACLTYAAWSLTQTDLFVHALWFVEMLKDNICFGFAHNLI